MTLAAIIFGVLAIGLGGVAVWLAVARGRILAKLAGVEAQRQAAETDLARLRSRADALDADVADLRVRAAQIEEGRRGAEQRHEGELGQREALYQQRLASLEAVHVEKLGAAEAARRAFEARVAELNEQVGARFRAMAAEALKESSGEFLRLAEQKFQAQQQAGQTELDRRREAVERIVKPIEETLRKTDSKLAEIEQQRTETFARLGERIDLITAANEQLRTETVKLVKALRDPQVRGRWGETQLKRVAELSGMIDRCDFCTQDSSRDGEGNLLRPDMVVQLPNGRVVAVDAKTNIRAYIEALEAETPDACESCLQRYAQHVADQVVALSRKNYWQQYDGSPEFVVMFIPGDQFIDAAVRRKPDLFDTAAEKKVIIASPSTLIALLRAVAAGWNERRFTEQARDLLRLGQELHERAAKVWEFAAKMGDALESTVKRYNEFVGSVDGRLTPTLKRFEEAGAKSIRPLAELEQISLRPRLLESTDDGTIEVVARPVLEGPERAPSASSGGTP